MNILLFLKKNVLVLTLMVLLIPAVISLFHSGFPPTHDGEYHVIRFYEFYRSFSLHNLYPRWAPDLNYGYGIPLFNFVYPLPNYISLFAHSLGFSFIDSFKLSMILASFVGGISMYLWSKIYWGKLGGIVSAVVYTYTPYHFVDMYVRGSIGEVWALALFPLLLFLSTRAIRENKIFWQALSGICLSLVILSHNILGLVFFEFYLCYSLLVILTQGVKKSDFYKVLIIVTIGLSISSIFWMPAIIEKSFVKGLEIYNPTENFPEIPQLLFPSWGTGFSNSDLQNQMSLQIGVINIMVIPMALYALYKIRKKIKKGDKLFYFLVFFITSFLVVVYLMTPYSRLVWDIIPLMNFFQFPWRLLSLTMLITSFLSGAIFYDALISRKKKGIISLLIIVLSIFLTYGYTIPAYYHDRNDSHYITRSNFIDGTNSPGNLFNTTWFSEVNKRPTVRFLAEEKSSVISKITSSGSNYSFNIKVESPTKIVGNIAFFPGWKYIVANKSREVNNEKGLISFSLPKGEYLVWVKFENTTIRNLATLISLLGFVFATGMLLYDFFTKKKFR